MKKFVTVILALLMLLTVPAMAENENANTLRVTGSATLSLAADRATLYIGANTTGASVEEAQDRSTAIMDKVLKAVENAGIPKKDIITNQYDVSVSNDEYIAGSIGKTTYHVNSMLFVAVNDLGILAKVVGEATKAGANSIYGLEFSSSKGEEAYDRVMKLAVEKAKKNAQTLADATGKKLGVIIRVEDGGVFRGQYAASNNLDMMSEKAAGAAIVTGDVSLSATVTLEFELAKSPLMP